MKRIVRLTESDLVKLVKRVIKEELENSPLEMLNKQFEWDFPEDPNEFDVRDLKELFLNVDSVREANELITDIYPGYEFVSIYQNEYGNQTIKFVSPEGEEITKEYLTNIGGSAYSRDLSQFRRDNRDAIFYSKHKSKNF